MILRLLLVALLLPASASGLELLRGPYLQRVGPNEVTVVFRTDVPCSGEFLWGSAPDALDQVVPTGANATEHVVVLTDLKPATRLFYDARCDGLRITAGIPPETMHFTTAPPAGSTSRVRAWVVGDSGTGSFAQLNVRDAAVSHWGADAPDLFLHMGDMAYGSGTDTQFTAFFFGVYSSILRSVPTFATMGNHEGATSESDLQEGPYYEAYVLPTDGRLGGVPSGTEAWYSFDWANVHFVVLESHQSDRSPEGPMLTWLAEDLAATDQEWIVAFWHHPPYTKGSHDSDYEGNHVQMRENAVPILEAGGVDLVLGGHSHIYERSYLVQGGYETPTTDQGIVDASDGRGTGDGPYAVEPGLAAGDGSVYVVAGHGGASVSQSGEHPLMYFAEAEQGSVLVDVVGNRLSLRNVRHDGEVTDSMTLLKGAGIDVALPDGGERFLPGSDVDITWGVVGADGPAVVEWTCDDGENWYPVGDANLEDGGIAWQAPFIETHAARVRVRSVDGSVTDTSDGQFSIRGRPVDSTPVPWGSRWRYRGEAAVPGPDWIAPGFDDGRWFEGPAELGFGDGDESTVIPADSAQASYLFRHTFWIPTEVSAATWQVRFDDGFALWINGELAGARNMENGFGMPAWASATSDDNEWAGSEAVTGRLQAGFNTLAVMVKQAPASTDDLSFDLQLDVSFSLDEQPASCVPEEVVGDDDDSAEVPALTDCSCGDSDSTAAFLPLLLLGGLPRRRR
ncbi:MAG: metallophosphoesterase family protein [Deltaproteobacteria bacterium]|nr:metallophosphoesterase family protein [Deltaproteobacteria bacterium]